ncbi:MAG: ParA family protein [Cycloclasticus sp.]
MNDKRGIIMVISSSKGGPGKTTTAQNLSCDFARQGFQVCLVDGDKQGSAEAWGLRRAGLGESMTLPRVVVKRMSGDLRQSLTDEARLYDLVIVDVAGRQSSELTSALLVADLVIVPAGATQKDLEEIPKLCKELHDTAMMAPKHRKAYGFINKVDPTANMKDIIADRDFFTHESMGGAFDVITTHLKYYPKAYDRADRMGAGVIEAVQLGTAQQSKARAQVQVLAEAVSRIINKIMQEITNEAA